MMHDDARRFFPGKDVDVPGFFGVRERGWFELIWRMGDAVGGPWSWSFDEGGVMKG